MILQRLLAVRVILSCLFCLAPFSGFLAAGEAEAPSPAPKPKDALEPDGIGELKNLAGKLKNAIEHHEKTMERLKEAHVFIANVQKECKNVQDARDNVKQTRERAVEALRKSQASQSEDDEAFEAWRTKTEEDYQKAKIRLEVEESSLRKHVGKLREFAESIQAEEIFMYEQKSVSQALNNTLQVLTEFLDGKLATKPSSTPEKEKTEAPKAETRKAEAPKPATGTSMPKSESPVDRQAQRAEFLRRQVDPFFLQPLVTVIPEPEHLEDFARQAMGDGNDSGDFNGSDCVLDYRFDHPARFPLPAYGFNGEHLEKPGVLIYEGMRLAIRPDGRYQVRFTAGAPPIPVTFQLQFQLLDQCTSQPYTLTLPPITLPTESKQSMSTVLHPPRSAFADLQTVHHEGYLPLFEDRFDFGNVVVIRRSGNARFGYGLRVP